MTKCKRMLPVLAAVAMAGCVTTEQMPDGTTKVRFSDEAVSSLTSMMPSSLVNGMAGGAGSGTLDLIPTKSLAGSGLYLYFNGRYDFACASALLYSAKTGQDLDKNTNEVCRDKYFQRQAELKLAGNPYDRAAPSYDPHNPPDAYWAQLKRQTLGQLANTQQFAARFTSIPRIDKNGNITMVPGFMGEGSGRHVALVTVPTRVPVVMDDAGFAAKMRSQANRLNTRSGEWTTCDAVLAYDSTRDKGRRPATISPSEYLQYEVRFKVASMSCRDGMHTYKTVSQ
ncbi:hypothetical protein I5S53_04755 [Pseudomonas juntendi]|uniref:hypothetical protein n=1 Tax=Pseudomonas TaxID=286 RepID=UPI000D931684|nr:MULTISPECIES: hypothetical protein [Pseudomonas]MBH3383288.1 hypothetical protein [Pseudomonas juntendi]PYC07983.1 hypothetical protein DMX12_04960 [Pseudomonas sp. MB-090624]